MPEAGGSTTQSGILYQNSIAALYLGRLLDASHRPDRERVSEVRVEAPTAVDDTVVTFADSHRIYIQAKESLRVNSSPWQKLWSDFDKQFRQKDFQRGQDRLCLQIGDGVPGDYDLQDLCVRAAHSPTLAEWDSRITQPQKKLLEQITPHFDPAGLTDEYGHSLLSHVDVVILPLRAIEQDRLRDWMPHTNRTQLELFRSLRDRIGGEARVKGIFTAHALRRDLLAESPDLRFEMPADIKALRDAVRQCSSLLRQHKNIISGTDIHILREPVDSMVEWLLEDNPQEKNVSILLDQAGMGKTVVMHDVLSELERRNVDVLAIKADQQLTSVSDLSKIQSKLNLPYPIEQVVGRLAQLNRVVILIDQIDALSLSRAHDQHALNTVLDLVARLQSIPNVCILLSCRIFDRNTDPRLRNIKAGRTFALSNLSEAQIQQILATLGVNFSDLSTATKALLKVPLHLDLFACAVAESDVGIDQLRGIDSLQELYALIWQYVVLRTEEGSPPLAERVEVISRLTEYMDRRQQTSAPHAVLQTGETQHLERAVRWLSSIGILIPSGIDWNFLHQTFFDYCYARNFVEKDGNIVENILGSRQGIFERSKLLQIIAYLRGYDHPRYIRDLNRLLNDPKLRFHLYDLLLRWFGLLPAPIDNEWSLALRMLSEPSRFPQLLDSMHGNPGWLPRIQPLISDWLADEVRRPYALAYLTSLVDIAQVEVISLLKPYLGRDEEWTGRITDILSRIRNWHTEEAVSLYEQTILRLVSLIGTCYGKSIEYG